MVVALRGRTIAVSIAACRRVDGFHEPVGVKECSFQIGGLEWLIEVVVLDVKRVGCAMYLADFDNLQAVRLRRGEGLSPVLGRAYRVHYLQFRVAALLTPVVEEAFQLGGYGEEKQDVEVRRSTKPLIVRVVASLGSQADSYHHLILV